MKCDSPVIWAALNLVPGGFLPKTVQHEIDRAAHSTGQVLAAGVDNPDMVFLASPVGQNFHQIPCRECLFRIEHGGTHNSEPFFCCRDQNLSALAVPAAIWLDFNGFSFMFKQPAWREATQTVMFPQLFGRGYDSRALQVGGRSVESEPERGQLAGNQA